MFLVFSSSCTTAGFIKEGKMVEEMNLSDGVNKKEAIILAKQFMIRKKLDSKYIISKHRVKFVDDIWIVSFPKRQSSSSLFKLDIRIGIRIEIDSRTGEIIHWGPDK